MKIFSEENQGLMFSNYVLADCAMVLDKTKRAHDVYTTLPERQRNVMTLR